MDTKSETLVFAVLVVGAFPTIGSRQEANRCGYDAFVAVIDFAP